MITVEFKVSEKEALALAQFVKRIGFSEMSDKAAGSEEAYLMLYGINALQRGLAEAGFAPR